MWYRERPPEVDVRVQLRMVMVYLDDTTDRAVISVTVQISSATADAYSAEPVLLNKQQKAELICTVT